jgi:superfamily I DNA/RNA helicase
MLRQLQKLLHRLVNEERVDCEDIVILTPRGEERTRLKPGSRLGMFTLTSFPSPRANTVQVTSVYRFKGLERRLVILTEVDTRTKYNADMVMYVGCSRARTHLVILHDLDAPTELVDRLSKKK